MGNLGQRSDPGFTGLLISAAIERGCIFLWLEPGKNKRRVGCDKDLRLPARRLAAKQLYQQSEPTGVNAVLDFVDCDDPGISG